MKTWFASPEVEDHGAEGGAAGVLGDGEHGQHVPHQRQDRHRRQHRAADHRLQWQGKYTGLG